MPEEFYPVEIAFRPAGEGTSSRSRRNSHGSAIVFFAVTVTLLVLVLGLVVDVGFWYTRRAQVQTAMDVALLSALGTLDQSLPYSTQVTTVETVALGILSNNAYDRTQFSLVCRPDTSGGQTFVSTATLMTTQALPTFFLAILPHLRPWMVVRSSAEKRVLEGTSVSCGVIALGSFLYNGGGTDAIDSYDSRSGGSYSPTNSDSGKLFGNANAHICSNGDMRTMGNIGMFGDLTTGGSLRHSGNSAIFGADLTAGGTIATAGSTVRGDVNPNETVPQFALPSRNPPPNIATSNDNALISGTCRPDAAGVLKCAGNKTTYLPAGGTYYFTDIDVASNCKFLVTGTPVPGQPTTIWVNGDVDLSGGMAFASSEAHSDTYDLGGVRPTDLIINGIAPSGSIYLRGHPKMVADIYAPSMDVYLSGNAKLYGRMRCRNIDISGTVSFTYDESLGYDTVTAPGSNVKVHLVE